MKKWFAFLLAAGLLSGCSTAADVKSTAAVPESTENTAAAPESAGQKKETAGEAAQNQVSSAGNEARTIAVKKEENAGIPENMTLYSSLPFQQEDKEWRLEMYAQGEVDQNGGLMLDDSCRFMIRVISGDESYRIFDDQVQLGVPSAGVLTDQNGGLHIMMQDTRTAKYEITDYLYNPQEQEFNGRKAVDYTGINYIGGTGTGTGTSSAERSGTGTTAAPSNGEEVCAFIKKIEGDTVFVNVAEYITTDDTERMKELNLTEEDMPDGYYVYDPDSEIEEFSLTPDTVYHFIDWGRDFVDSDMFEDLNIYTTTKAVFLKYLKTYKNSVPGMPFFFQMQDGKVAKIVEKPMV